MCVLVVLFASSRYVLEINFVKISFQESMFFVNNQFSLMSFWASPAILYRRAGFSINFSKASYHSSKLPAKKPFSPFFITDSYGEILLKTPQIPFALYSKYFKLLLQRLNKLSASGAIAISNSSVWKNLTKLMYTLVGEECQMTPFTFVSSSGKGVPQIST